MSITRDTFVKFDRASARSRDVGDSIVIMDLKNSVYFSIEGSIAQVWPAFVEGVVLRDAATSLAEVFDTDASEIETDLVELCSNLDERGVLETR
ncbi:PqqD family protein [Ilumatobacter sp.]|uniref:PqqD family protein n=1 Tax=Ilumatobacter sp. TaxID=1967498 RepID=UPI003B51EE73